MKKTSKKSPTKASKKTSARRPQKTAAARKRSTTRTKQSYDHEQLLGRVISDPEFRQKLFKNPRKVLKDYYSGEQAESALEFVNRLQSSMAANGDAALQDLRHMKLGFL